MKLCSARFCVTLAAILAVASGCTENPNTPELGTITINPEPNSINAPWLLAGPNGFTQSGSGDLAIANMSAGIYSLTWQAVSEWTTPDPAVTTQVLVANGAVNFAGTYVAQRGTVMIDAEPNTLNAPWHLAGPNGFEHTGSGDAALFNVAVGSYTLTWGSVAGWDAPTPAVDSQVLMPGLPLEFVGTYVHQFPNTPDKLIENLRRIYESMDIAEYPELLRSDFVTILQASTIAAFPDVGPDLDVTEELRIHERMFAGLDVLDPEGQLVPGIKQIQFQTIVRQGDWEISPANDPIPNTDNALYDVSLVFDRGQTYTTLRVQGSIRFYVTHRDSLVDGVPVPYYQLIAEKDLTLDQKSADRTGKAIEYVAWGTLKALFR